MNEKLTELVFILDRSGSMGGLESDTIGGFNSMIGKQKKEEGEAFVTTILFDDQVETLHDRVEVKKLEPITDKEYYVRGCTALLDAIGETIEKIDTIHKYAREEDIPAKTLFVITTDGMENASKKFDYKKIKHMIEKHQEKEHWEFLFLGANIDSIEVAGRMGINASHAVNYECDSAGTALNYDILGRAVSKVRKMAAMESCCAAPQMLDDGWKADIEKDYKKRHKK